MARRHEHGVSQPGEPKRLPAKGKICKVGGCERPVFSRLLCKRHYRRAAKGLLLTSPDDDKIIGVTRTGHSLWGVVERDGERLICHECGRSYINLAVHIAMAHKSVKQYRLDHGLTMRQQLVSDSLRERKKQIGRTVAHNLVSSRSPETLKQASQTLITRGKRLSMGSRSQVS